MNRKITSIRWHGFLLFLVGHFVCQASTNCIPTSSGLVSWWRAEGGSTDFSGGNNGTPTGSASFTTGVVGQGFSFVANGDAIIIGNPSNLVSQNFTVEAWIQRSSDSIVSFSAAGSGHIFGYGFGGYAFVVAPNGTLALTSVGISFTSAGPAISNTFPHHVAVTRNGGTVYFYIDGIPYKAPDYPGNFGFSTPAVIGARGDNLDNSFFGMIDEVSVYNRALTAAEIQAVFDSGSYGKCTAPSAPVFIQHPTNTTVFAGESVSFFSTALGDNPVAYQWTRNGTNLLGATNQC